MTRNGNAPMFGSGVPERTREGLFVQADFAHQLAANIDLQLAKQDTLQGSLDDLAATVRRAVNPRYLSRLFEMNSGETVQWVTVFPDAGQWVADQLVCWARNTATGTFQIDVAGVAPGGSLVSFAFDAGDLFSRPLGLPVEPNQPLSVTASAGTGVAAVLVRFARYGT